MDNHRDTASVRSVTSPSGSIYRFGEFCYETRNRLLTHGPETIRTTPKALHVLEVLLQSQGNLVTLDELTKTVWAGVYIDRATIHQNVATLRRLLNDDPKNATFIETVPRTGYRFIHAVEVEPEGGAPVAMPSGGKRLRHIGGLAFAVVVLIAGVVFQGLGRPDSGGRKSPAQAEYELGRQYWNQRLYRPQAEAAQQAFRQAIRLDPNFALAHVGLADSFLFETDTAANAEREIREALALDPKLGEPMPRSAFFACFTTRTGTAPKMPFNGASRSSLTTRPDTSGAELSS